MAGGLGRGHRKTLIPTRVCADCQHAQVYSRGLFRGRPQVTLVRCARGHWERASYQTVADGRRDRRECADFERAGEEKP